MDLLLGLVIGLRWLDDTIVTKDEKCRWCRLPVRREDIEKSRPLELDDVRDRSPCFKDGRGREAARGSLGR
mgnify:CR=1 FL=1